MNAGTQFKIGDRFKKDGLLLELISNDTIMCLERKDPSWLAWSEGEVWQYDNMNSWLIQGKFEYIGNFTKSSSFKTLYEKLQS